MKKKFYLLVFALFVCTSFHPVFSQINLKKTFDGQVLTLRYPYYEPSDYDYAVLDNRIEIYDPIDNSVFKYIPLTPPDGYSLVGVSNISKYLFDADERFEFVAHFDLIDPFGVDPNERNKYVVYKDNGTLVKDLGTGVQYVYIYRDSEGNLSLYLFRHTYNPSTYKTEVYSLPGKAVTRVSEEYASTDLYPYPNPAKSFINIEYDIDNPAAMRILSLDGKLMREVQLDPVKQMYTLDTSAFPSGNYVYTYGNTSGKFIVK